MTAEVLATIDGALEEWHATGEAWRAEAMRWQPGPVPQLSPRQMEIAGQVAARTGCDGYAAVFMVADVAVYGEASPFADEVTGAAFQVPAECEPIALIRASRDDVWVSLARFRRVTWRSCFVTAAAMLGSAALSWVLAAWHAPLVSLTVPLLVMAGAVVRHWAVMRREIARHRQVCSILPER